MDMTSAKRCIYHMYVCNNKAPACTGPMELLMGSDVQLTSYAKQAPFWPRRITGSWRTACERFLALNFQAAPPSTPASSQSLPRLAFATNTCASRHCSCSAALCTPLLSPTLVARAALRFVIGLSAAT